MRKRWHGKGGRRPPRQNKSQPSQRPAMSSTTQKRKERNQRQDGILNWSDCLCPLLDGQLDTQQVGLERQDGWLPDIPTGLGFFFSTRPQNLCLTVTNQWFPPLKRKTSKMIHTLHTQTQVTQFNQTWGYPITHRPNSWPITSSFSVSIFKKQRNPSIATFIFSGKEWNKKKTTHNQFDRSSLVVVTIKLSVDCIRKDSRALARAKSGKKFSLEFSFSEKRAGRAGTCFTRTPFPCYFGIARWHTLVHIQSKERMMMFFRALDPPKIPVTITHTHRHLHTLICGG